MNSISAAKSRRIQHISRDQRRLREISRKFRVTGSVKLRLRLSVNCKSLSPWGLASVCAYGTCHALAQVIMTASLLKKFALLPWFIAATVVVSAVPAFAQSSATVASLQQQIDALQRQLQSVQLQSTVSTDAATADGNPKTAKTTEEAIEELAAEIKILARQVELDKEAAAEKARTVAQPAASRSGFSVQSADGNFRLRLRGYLHS